MQMHTAQSLFEVHGFTDAAARERRNASLAASIRDRLSAARTAFSKWLRYRRDVDALHRMDDRMLRDIGLTRSEISHVVRFGRDDD